MPAATLTVRHTPSAGGPVAGSTQVVDSSPASSRQRRTVVLEVARPPERSVIHWPGRRRPAR